MTVIQPNSISGVSSITAQGGDINLFRADGTKADIPIVNNITGVAATFTGNLNVGGVLTYEDVTNVDSVGLITARSGINVSSGKVIIGHTAANGKLQVNNGTNSAVGDSTNPAFQIGGTTTYRLGMFTTTEQVIIANKNGDDGIAFHTKTADNGSFGEALSISSAGNLTVTGSTSNLFSSNSYNVLELRADENNDGGNDDIILKFTHDGTFRSEMRYDESSSTLELSTSDNRGDLIITSDGYVTKSNQPSFTAKSTGTWGHGSSTGTLDIDINMVEEFDVGGNYDGQIFTAPVAGKYFFSYTFQYKCTSGYIEVSLRKGVGGTYSQYGNMIMYPPQQSTTYHGPGIIGIIDLAANNTVKPVAQVNYAGNQIQNVNFSGYLLG